ncbi:MAG: type I restriction enzyme HsdR N-terminal domain-containing protein [Prevotella sp.]|nr:type I restriction enzyme HsdR N-terminal domain-containing protein [Bacteroides sp.]MCM1365908.1 type I restriction enzyme HsdR N-terminal domain-containing protein [Prevotella sp.]
MNHSKEPQWDLPRYDMKIERRGNQVKVFDRWRKKYVALTPEEFVRQHFANWLCNYLHYPDPLISNEVSIVLNDNKRRCDTIVYGQDGKPFIIVEYKAPTVCITQDVFDQIVRYNMVLRAKYIVVSNGLNHYCCIIDYSSETYQFIHSIPDYLSFSLS